MNICRSRARLAKSLFLMREKDDSEALSALYSEIEAKEVLLASLTGKNNRNRRKALRGAIEPDPN